MAAGTILAGTTLALGAYQAITGASQERSAKRAANSFTRTVTSNTQEGRRVSRLGADLAVEGQTRATATSIDALRKGGVRGTVGGTGDVVAANNDNMRRIGAGLDQQQVAIDEAYARDEARIQGVKENRDYQELQAIQGQVNAGNQQKWDGLGTIASGISGMVTDGGLDGLSFGGGKEVDPMANYNPQVGAAKVTARNVFGNIKNPLAGQTIINPLTGKPYIS